MPTFTPFYTSALGNGFPFCLNSVNVSDKGDGTPYDYWTTLGGTNKDNLDTLTTEQKAENISLSLQHAWRLFWILNGWSITWTNSPGLLSDYSIDLSADTFSHDPTSFGEVGRANAWTLTQKEETPPPTYVEKLDTNKAPIDRVCVRNFRIDVVEDEGTLYPALTAAVGVNIIKMYNGEEFVGYGIGGSGFSGGNWPYNMLNGFLGIGWSGEQVVLGGYSTDAEIDTTGELLTYEYVQWQGIHFLAKIYVSALGDSIEYEVAALPEGFSVDINHVGAPQYSSIISFNSIDFYEPVV